MFDVPFTEIRLRRRNGEFSRVSVESACRRRHNEGFSESKAAPTLWSSQIITEIPSPVGEDVWHDDLELQLGAAAMGLFKLEIPSRMMFTQILQVGGRRMLAWNARSPRLNSPNVLRVDRRFEARSRDKQLVNDFRAKLRQTEDLIGKLDYSLREIFKN